MGPVLVPAALPPRMSRAILLGLELASTFRLYLLSIYSLYTHMPPMELLGIVLPNKCPLLVLRELCFLHLFILGDDLATSPQPPLSY